MRRLLVTLVATVALAGAAPALADPQPTRADISAADELDLFAIRLDRMSWRALNNHHLTRSVVLHDAADKAHERAAVLRHGA